MACFYMAALYPHCLRALVDDMTGVMLKGTEHLNLSWQVWCEKAATTFLCFHFHTDVLRQALTKLDRHKFLALCSNLHILPFVYLVLRSFHGPAKGWIITIMDKKTHYDVEKIHICFLFQCFTFLSPVFCLSICRHGSSVIWPCKVESQLTTAC